MLVDDVWRTSTGAVVARWLGAGPLTAEVRLRMTIRKEKLEHEGSAPWGRAMGRFGLAGRSTAGLEVRVVGLDIMIGFLIDGPNKRGQGKTDKNIILLSSRPPPALLVPTTDTASSTARTAGPAPYGVVRGRPRHGDRMRSRPSEDIWISRR